MFEDIPVDVSVAHAGERIRKNDVYVELGGPDIAEKFELVKVRPADQVSDGAVRIVGPRSSPFAIRRWSAPSDGSGS